MENYECQYCLTDFKTLKEKNRHQKTRPQNCINMEYKLRIRDEKISAKQNTEQKVENAKLAKKLAEQKIKITKLAEQKAEVDKQLAEYKSEIAELIEQKADAEKKLVEQKAAIVEKHEMVVDQLIYSKPAVRERKKVVKDVRSRKKIPSFRSVLANAKGIYKLDDLKIYVRLDGEGDIMIFKDLFIDRPEPSERCINTLDSARDKYEIFDGHHWITMKLRDIVDIFMDSLADLYYPVLQEKHTMLDDVDKKYPRWSGDDAVIEQNTQAYNEVTDMFISATEHHASLLSKKEDLHNEIKNGIQGLLLKMKN